MCVSIDIDWICVELERQLKCTAFDSELCRWIQAMFYFIFLVFFVALIDNIGTSKLQQNHLFLCLCKQKNRKILFVLHLRSSFLRVEKRQIVCKYKRQKHKNKCNLAMFKNWKMLFYLKRNNIIMFWKKQNSCYLIICSDRDTTNLINSQKCFTFLKILKNARK